MAEHGSLVAAYLARLSRTGLISDDHLEEMSSHLVDRVETYLMTGMTAVESEKAALADFGDIETVAAALSANRSGRFQNLATKRATAVAAAAGGWIMVTTAVLTGVVSTVRHPLVTQIQPVLPHLAIIAASGVLLALLGFTLSLHVITSLPRAALVVAVWTAFQAMLVVSDDFIVATVLLALATLIATTRDSLLARRRWLRLTLRWTLLLAVAVTLSIQLTGWRQNSSGQPPATLLTTVWIASEAIYGFALIRASVAIRGMCPPSRGRTSLALRGWPGRRVEA